MAIVPVGDFPLRSIIHRDTVMALDTARIAAETGSLLAYQADTGSRIGTTRRQVAYEG